MAQRKSTGLVNFIADSGSARNALGNSKIYIYTGTQPTTADDPVTGTLLVTLTNGGGTYTPESLPQWKFTLSGSAGSVNSIKIGGVECLSAPVTYTASLNDTAAAVAANITNFFSIPDYRATASGASVTITGPVGSGANLNDLSVIVDTTTLVVTYDDTGATGAVFAAGVTCVNGCNFKFPATTGVLTKETTDWSGVAAATGSAGWFRIEADAADTKGTSTIFRRLDGAISTSGAEMNVTSTSITAGGTFSINTGSFTITK